MDPSALGTALKIVGALIAVTSLVCGLLGGVLLGWWLA